MGSFVTCLEAALDGTVLPHDIPQTTHEGRPLLVRYDLAAVGRAVDRDALRDRPADLWRYAELLPVEDPANRVSLGEGMTPLVRCTRLERELPCRLWIKDESQLPTGSFKARGLCLAVSRAKELGLEHLAIPTAGNAGGALAAYAARAGLACTVFLPRDTPRVACLEVAHFGANTWLVDGLITDCAQLVREGARRYGWFDLSTLKEPYRIEGKKTMGLELAEQMGWRLPHTILYPTGGGTGLIGMWKAFAELGTLGWLEADSLPRLYACQAEGCAPIVRAWEAGERFAEPVKNPSTRASGLRVPAAVGDFMILDAVRASGGAARAVSEDALLANMHRAARLEGISLCPEAGACLAVLAELVREGAVTPEDDVVVYNTGAVQKYVELIERELSDLGRPEDVDWSRIEAGAL